MTDRHLEYLQLVTRHQAAIYGYLRTIAPGAPLEDILQEVNIVLWNRAADFEAFVRDDVQRRRRVEARANQRLQG